MIPEIAHHADKFYYFYEIALSGGFQPASRKIGLSAATLSYSIKQLEDVLGSPLFIRHHKGIQLTDSGQVLLNFCRKFYRDLEDVNHFISHPKSDVLQKIKVGTFQSIAIYLWPLLVESLQNSTDISLSLTTNRSHLIMESLYKGEIDIALTVEGSTHKNIIKQELYKDHYAFYSNKKLRKKILAAGDIEQYPVLFMPEAVDQEGTTIRQYLDSWDLKFKSEFELDSLEVISEFIEQGHGIGILPKRVAQGGKRSFLQKKIAGLSSSEFGQHRFFLSYRADQSLSQKTVDLLIEASKKAAGVTHKD